MINDNITKENKNNTGMNAATAWAIGVLVGVAGAAAVVLSDAQMRKRVAHKAGELSRNLGNWGNEKLKNIQKMSKKATDSVKENASKIIDEKPKQLAESIKEKTSRTVH